MRLFDRLRQPSVRASHRYMNAGAKLFHGGVAEAAVVTQAGESLFHPYVRRPVPLGDGSFDLISPYDYGGFWFSTIDVERRRELVRIFETEFVEHALAQRIVAQFVRLHPLIDPAELRLSAYEVRKHQDNVIIPVADSIDAVRAGYTAKRRSTVRQGIRYGLTLKFGSDVEGFCSLYDASMQRLGADREYYFPVEFLRTALEFGRLAEVRDLQGALCSAYVLLYDGDGVYLYLAASAQNKQHLRPNDFAYDAIAQSALAEGLRFFHLGGGGESLLFHKRSFSPVSVRYHHLRRIFDPVRYAELTQVHLERVGRPPSPSFFPAYRDGLREVRLTASEIDRTAARR